MVIDKVTASAMGDKTMVKKKVFAFTLTALILLSSVGCTNPFYYNGSHPELFVVATHSLLGVRGGIGQDILILEEDAFGRVLFAYVGFTLARNDMAFYNILAILIAQKTTEEHSYFYPGINFIFYEIEVQNRSPQTTSARELFLDQGFVMDRICEAQLDQLKIENNWNEALNEDKFFRVPISRHHKVRYMTAVSEEARQEAYLTVAEGVQLLPAYSIPLTMDINGNIIFFARGRRRDNATWIFYPAVLLMFDADGNFIKETGAMELTDLRDYRDQLREFKEANNWSFYYDQTQPDS